MPHSASLPVATTRWLPCGALGSGSFGQVSLAINLADQSLFAIKSCPSSSDPHSPFLLSLLNELDILQSLDSPFIVRCLGAQFDSAAPSPTIRSLFLEYMDGGSLATLLRRRGGKLNDERVAARYTRAILQGLDYLHGKGIVHCDIKSHNILIGSSGVKIADFGAARRMKTEGSAAMDGVLRGTPLYMAPEVAQGIEQGPPSDIWSLGCTLVEMLQGRPPWGHIKSLAALFLKLGSSDECIPLPPSISAEAEDFIRLCLRKDTQARPTAAELLQHPFLRVEGAADEIWIEEMPSTPTSTLTLAELSECRDESFRRARAASILGGPACKGSPTPFRSTEPDALDNQWVTVKSGGRSVGRQGDGRRQGPFSVTDEGRSVFSGGRDGVIEVRKGSEVNLECAAFLMRRRRQNRRSSLTTVG
ncbi:hypothetical protein KP509_02G092400 [Ceratopteris richardii]|uniref:Protein kinase domain-containing protein n=1 Tax=Ceratopteris richardii TaxID=49495 RepID=A0A8T2V8M6_CERRI|nr:hypothetical protein KP509_02G092400 [Ceratopteris richardii]